jgi:hypothetical protein
VQKELGKKKRNVKAEDVFKIVACLVVIMWSVCLKDFFNFRTYLQENNLFHFDTGYLWYALVGFSFVFVRVFVI